MNADSKSESENGFEEGTLIAVLTLRDYSWPPKANTLLMKSEVKHTHVSITARVDSSLEVVVGSASKEIARGHFQRISLKGRGNVLICVRWSSSGLDLDIGDHTLHVFDATNQSVLDVHLREPSILEGPSIGNAESAKRCASRIQWRKKHFARLATNINLATGEKRKSIDEQLYELGQSRQALLLLLTLFSKGMGFLGGALATELRALLSLNGKSYNPLLLRLAAAKDLPLPVYVLPEINLPVNSWICSREAMDCAIWKTLPAQEIIDLEDWLKRTLVTKRRAAQTQYYGGDRVVRVADLIDEIPNYLGSAHYSLKLSDRVEEMFAVKVGGRSAAMAFLLSAATAAIALSGYVLREFGVLDNAILAKELLQFQPGRIASL